MALALQAVKSETSASFLVNTNRGRCMHVHSAQQDTAFIASRKPSRQRTICVYDDYILDKKMWGEYLIFHAAVLHFSLHR